MSSNISHGRPVCARLYGTWRATRLPARKAAALIAVGLFRIEHRVRTSQIAGVGRLADKASLTRLAQIEIRLTESPTTALARIRPRTPVIERTSLMADDSPIATTGGYSCRKRRSCLGTRRV